ncbi:tyrosine-type recombinase/integrase [Kytococcus sedentarius]|uniref:tyrosine-type recombinase/integrase n=1 Tax=Kytococcus sedentarius TaxID=1276 RepID=UPI0019526084|nr:site-specific integrase [Kytococcus sedentarius]QRO87190.1 site-specific integrase [Kytococcus sedentarius]
MTRAKREFGTIRKRSKRWSAHYMGPDQAFHYGPTTFETKADAETWLMGERRLIQREEWTPPKGRRKKVLKQSLAFEVYAERWLANRELKPRTADQYRRLMDRFLLPGFRGLPLRNITPADVREWYATLDPSRPTQRAHAYSLLRSVLQTAFEDELVGSNPCKIRGASVTKRARRVEPATLDEMALLIEHLPGRYGALVLIGAWCGLRLGEMIELRRNDVDLKHGVIRVRRGLVRVRGEVSVGTPKTQAGIRDVAIPPHLISELRAHLDTFVGPAPDDLVFPSVGDRNTQVHPNTIYRHWYRAREAAGRPDLRIHDLRHTGAVMAAQSGATIAELMARIGHSTPQAAMRYQHAAQGRDAALALRMSELASEQGTNAKETGCP